MRFRNAIIIRKSMRIISLRVPNPLELPDRRQVWYSGVTPCRRKVMTQVVIVGAGPTGATLALLLVQRGIAVKLIEASRNFRRVFRGEGLMPSGLDALDLTGLSSVLESIPHRPLDAWEVLIENRFLFRVDEPIEPGGKPCTLVSQPAFLEAAIDQASTYPNFEFVQGSPVQDLLWSEQRVSGVKPGDDRSIHANLVI